MMPHEVSDLEVRILEHLIDCTHAVTLTSLVQKIEPDHPMFVQLAISELADKGLVSKYVLENHVTEVVLITPLGRGTYNVIIRGGQCDS